MHFGCGLSGGGPKARRQASPGQRPGSRVGTEPALKGRNRGCRPFRAGAFSPGFPGRCPGLACFRTFGAPSRRASTVHDRLQTEQSQAVVLLRLPHSAELLPAWLFVCDFHGDFREALAGRRAEFGRSGGFSFGLEVESVAEKLERAAVDGVNAGSRMAGEAQQGLIGFLLGERFEFVRPIKERR